MDTVQVGDFLGKVSIDIGSLGLTKCTDDNFVSKQVQRPLTDWLPGDKIVYPHKFRSTQVTNLCMDCLFYSCPPLTQSLTQSLKITRQTDIHKCPSRIEKKPETPETQIEHRRSTLSSGILGSQKKSSHMSISDLEVEDKQSSKFAIYASIAMILSYLGVSVLFYSCLVDKYTVRESLYMAVATFTTVGYGDILPTNDNAKVFACFHAFSGILFIGAGVGILVSAFIKAELANADAKEEEHAEKMVAMLDTTSDEDNEATKSTKSKSAYTPDLSTKSGCKEMKNIQDTAREFDEKNKGEFDLKNNLKRHLLFKVMKLWFIPIVVLVTGACVIGSLEDWTPIDSCYWVMITACR